MELKFNIVYIPGATRYQSLFTFSLLKWSDYSFRLVANGCSPDEMRWLRRLCSKSPRLEFLALPFKKTVKHGLALSYLHRLKCSDHFCFMDSDILATGDFSSDVSQYLNGYTGFFSCLPICFKTEEKILPQSYPGIYGRHHCTKEGICLGGTYFAIYDNQVMGKVIQSTGIDLRRYWWSDIPKQYQNSLDRLGLKKDWYDTGKVLNLLLIAQGEQLVFREIPALEHIGGTSIICRSNRKSNKRKPLTRELALLWKKLMCRPESSVRTVPKQRNKGSPATEAGRMITRRKRIYAHYCARLLQALFEDRPLPVRPTIGETEVEERIDLVTKHLVNLYLDYKDTVKGRDN